MEPLAKAIQRYEALTDELAQDSNRHFGAIGDPCFEGVRFYTFKSMSGSFNLDGAVELESDAADEIEDYLMQAESGYSLLAPMLSKLKTVAPAFNANGKAIFLGSWGMGLGEVGWMIRHLNNRRVFEQFLQDTGIGEDAVDAYSDVYERDLTEAEQGVGGQPATPPRVGD